jgi:hypothetical protein
MYFAPPEGNTRQVPGLRRADFATFSQSNTPTDLIIRNRLIL